MNSFPYMINLLSIGECDKDEKTLFTFIDQFIDNEFPYVSVIEGGFIVKLSYYMK